MSDRSKSVDIAAHGWSWDEAEKRLVAARSYWICTTRADGRPHAAPVWGVWVDGALYFGTDEDSVKGRNIARSPQVTVHLDSGDEVVIFEGIARRVSVAGGARPEVTESYGGKYSMPDGTPIRLDDGPPGAESTLLQVKPDRALAWAEADFLATRNRFRFNGDGHVTALGWSPDEP